MKSENCMLAVSKTMLDMQRDANCYVQCNAYEAELLEAFADAEN
jgi:hypothetical protein